MKTDYTADAFLENLYPRLAGDAFAEARDAVQRGEVLGFFYIPDNLEELALGGRQPVVSFYVNYAYYAPGSMQYKGFKTM